MKSKSLLHISDLHFGRINPKALQSLITFITSQKVDCVVITGDITHRAKSKQFYEAQEFVKKITHPIVAIPGNHDVPLYNIFQRFFKTFNKYDKFIKPFTSTIYHDEEMLVVGMTTNNIFRVADGRISEKETVIIEEHFNNNPKQKIRILACHHPLFKKISRRTSKKLLQEKVLALTPHLILSGHDHESAVEFLNPSEKKFPLLVAAGTGTSTRLRKEANSINLIQISEKDSKLKLTIEHYTYVKEQSTFLPHKTFEFIG